MFVYLLTENGDFDAPSYASVHLSLAGAMVRAEAITYDDIAMSEWCETVENNYWSNQSRGLCIERLKVED